MPMADHESDEGFLSRWSRRKAEARRATVIPAPAPTEPAPQVESVRAAAEPTATVPSAPASRAVEAPTEPPPTLADVARLTRDSDFRRFVCGDVDREVKNAALKKLFADPHFAELDGLDVYVDDYSRPDPIPASMLGKIAQAKLLDLIAEKLQPDPHRDRVAHGAANVENATATAVAATETPVPDENADLQLQSHDAAGRAGAEPGPGGDGGCEQQRTG
jgi:hypothetical protein